MTELKISAIARIYFIRVHSGEIKIDDVPPSKQEEVRYLLSEAAKTS